MFSANLIPRVSHLTTSEANTPGGGKIRDPGNEVDIQEEGNWFSQVGKPF